MRFEVVGRNAIFVGMRARGGSEQARRGQRVLVVDDEPFNVDLLTQELAELGIRGVPAANGR